VSTYAGILERMKAQGYDVSLLKKVPQRIESP